MDEEKLKWCESGCKGCMQVKQVPRGSPSCWWGSIPTKTSCWGRNRQPQLPASQIAHQCYCALNARAAASQSDHHRLQSNRRRPG
ncbi:Os07g0696000 [Oryza sativa Japonica Group]|uniref:Os07g0696000 protein n=1 Tax=Oryza sativa subsp. japonica TaxID=39947 RepID=Q0D3B0_ORYSJ|nr:Os07g0696000 [Oryza sativa Japonica Group]|eukprot:NP_001060749.1 Os07g0696000 [Oryza sativa Japonica Group]